MPNTFGQTYVSPASFFSTPASPTAPASTSAYKCQGLGALITPVTPSGKVLAIITGTLNAGQTTVGTGINLQLAYGPISSGVAAPANAAALPASGTTVGNVVTWETGVTLTTAADSFVPFTVSAVLTGLTPGQQYWVDLMAESITTASQCQVTIPCVCLVEIG